MLSKIIDRFCFDTAGSFRLFTYCLLGNLMVASVLLFGFLSDQTKAQDSCVVNDFAPTQSKQFPSAVWLDSSQQLFYSDAWAGKVTKITDLNTGAGGIVVAGAVADGNPPSGDGDKATSGNVRINPSSACGAPNGDLYIVVMSQFHGVRKVTASSGIISAFGGKTGETSGDYGGDNGRATSARFASPSQCVVLASGDVLVADTNNDRIRLVTQGG